MIGYVTLGTKDLDQATAFYDFLFRVVGLRRRAEEPGRYVAWEQGPNAPAVTLRLPAEGERAAAGDASTVALELKSPAEVAAMHALAVALGATDEGAPAARDDGRCFAACFRDRDGNRLNAFCVMHA